MLKFFLISLGVFAFIIFIAFPLFYLFIAQPYKVSGRAMFPTLNNGEYILAEKFSIAFDNLGRGDIILFKNPDIKNQDFIKRLIGLPGEKLSIHSGEVYINNQPLDEGYLPENIFTRAILYPLEEGEITVPDGSFYVLNDNRDQELDSRKFGFVKKEDVIGKYWFRYY